MGRGQFFCRLSPSSAMKIAELNHVALRVRDVDASIRFYRDIIGLPVLPRPDFNFRGAWFRIGTYQELHLIEGGTGRPDEDSARDNHFALRVTDFEASAAQMQVANVVFRGPVRRPDGARQIFLKDPDGHVLELCGELPPLSP
jgi:lactoylglutathione lyase